ncbi:hypothetical protein [Mesorhizobium sp.]|uniref:hypothetical protein n=1 Tax=Mesorhizobium sp. TaxID=1871066 RepID=UPI000FE4913F|nr:hypothetical protein [Mesorhizobium sp.]RWF66882.1 MAG: hypothetical protein EOS47_04670 [Mesorhizobium sp.]TIT42343.1 MAG: hypothetical protein E5W76_10885 [Mesorhizobium sp.]
MSTASDLHNLLSGRFVRDVIGPAVKNGATYSELMVLFESVQLSMLEILNRHYEVAPAAAVGLLEASLQTAIERFAGNRKPSNG